MKKLVSFLLALSMMLSLVSTTVTAAPTSDSVKVTNPFTDVSKNEWFYDAVQYANINGFFNGTSDTTFTPDGTMTRGMFVTVLGRMAGVDTENYNGETPFGDVMANAYYAPYVAWASKHGITSGMGEGAFEPDGLINREQMATFFVRYFNKFDVDYSTGENITTLPKDIDTVSPWAQEAVKSLWKYGLLNGDGNNFNPTFDATRAQTAVIAQRTDNVVESWYKEPGVLSEREKITLETNTPSDEKEEQEKGEEREEPQKPVTTRRPSSGGGGASIQYYEVNFEAGEDSGEITLPPTATYPAGTPISSLPTPSKTGTIFLGWFYDSQLTDAVKSGDTVDKNLTLYAKIAAGEEVTSLETPNYITRTDVAEGTYSFDIIGALNINSAFKFVNITGGNTDVDYNINGTTVSATLEAGQTYQVELTDKAAQLKLSGEDAQPTSTRYLNILTAKETATNAELHNSVKQIPVTATSGLGRDVFEGLYRIDDSGTATQNDSNGTFTYTGNIAINPGDTVAITSGDVDLSDVTSTKGDVAYVKITGVSDDTYSYVMADLDDVLFIADILPIQSNWDGDSVDNQITVSVNNISSSMNSVEAQSLDVGDFLGFLASGESYSDADNVSSYGKITNVSKSGDNYIIGYTSASESEVENSLDVYYTQDKEIELTDKEKNEIENNVKNDVQSSGYVEEAALYLASVMLESNNLEEIPDLDKVAFSMSALQGSTALYGDSSVTREDDKNKVKVSFDKNNIKVSVASNKTLEHLKGKGFDVSVKIPFTVTITSPDGDKMYIKVTAEFEEEVILKQSISTARHKIGFLKYDYSLNATFEVGNYTGIHFNADIDSDNGTSSDLSQKLKAIMKQMESYQNGTSDSNNEAMASLSEIYQQVMAKTNDTWIDIIDVKLFETNGSAFLHIFCWQVKGSFVVSANLCVSLGMDFDYTMQKKYNFSVRVKAKSATNQVIDIIEPHYNFDFYVVGTLGIRAGLRLEMYVGLISLKLDKIGITAEVGAYTRLWGYFFYHLEWAQNSGKKSSSAGAMLVDIGIYLEIKFVAQVFSSNKLTWNPTLYSKEWPLWSAGEQKNVYAFKNSANTNYNLVTTKTLALPGNTYEMSYINLKTGKTGTMSKDDAGETNFIISFSNPLFTYNPANNTITVTPVDGALELESDMSITWKKAALTFTSRPIQKVIHLKWSDPEGMHYINFDSMGGNAVEQLSCGTDAPITWPSDPTREGYEFNGWYTDADCMTPYSGTTTRMPEFTDGIKGITLYAKWNASDVNYAVEHYLQELNGTYKLDTTQTMQGKNGSTTTAQAFGIYPGFVAKDIEQQTIAGDGSTVVKVYYDREVYTLTFIKNDGSDENITRTYLYGESVAAPILARDGYTFEGWDTTLPEEAVESATYRANWLGNNNTVIFDSCGGSAIGSETVRTGEKVQEPQAPTKTGCTFEGWYKDALCTEAWNFNADVVFGATTLYAKWSVTQHTVTWDTNGGNALSGGSYTNGAVDYGTQITAPANPTKDSYQGTKYTFAGWNTAKDGSGTTLGLGDKVTSDVTYYAQWNLTTTKYTVEWIISDTTVETDNDLVWGDAVTYDGTVPTKDADVQYTYTFDHWNTKADGSGDKWKSGDTVSGDVTYYAQFATKLNKYTVNWDANGGNALSGDYTNGEVNYNTPITPPNAPTRDYYQGKTYTFASWNTAKDGSGTTLGLSDKVTDNVTYYAQWDITYTKYTVKWVVGSTEAETDTNLIWGDRVTYNGATPTKASTAKYSYTFDGWNTKADGTGDKLMSGDTVSGDVTYYAQFTSTVNKYTVNWYTEDGVILDTTYTTRGEYGTEIVAPTNVIKAKDVGYEYSFEGWYNADGTRVENFGTITGDVTYYAQYVAIPNTYTVTFEPNGGGAVSPKQIDYNCIIPEQGRPVRPDTDTEIYTFEGWYADEALTTKWNFATDKVKGDMTLYAKWNVQKIMNYGIWVGDTEITTSRLTVSNGSNYVSYNPTSNTLHINGKISYSVQNGATITIDNKDLEELNVNFVGDCSVINSYNPGNGETAYGIWVKSYTNLRINAYKEYDVDGSAVYPYFTCRAGSPLGYDGTDSKELSKCVGISSVSNIYFNIEGNIDCSAVKADHCIGIECNMLWIEHGQMIGFVDNINTSGQETDTLAGKGYAFSGSTIKVFNDSSLTLRSPSQAINISNYSIMFEGESNLKTMASTLISPSTMFLVPWTQADNNNYKYVYVVNTDRL